MPPPVIQAGSTGEWVQYLEQMLQHYGHFSGTPDVTFSDATAAALRSFQEASGITAEPGFAGEITWAMLGVSADGTTVNMPEENVSGHATSSADVGLAPNGQSWEDWHQRILAGEIAITLAEVAEIFHVSHSALSIGSATLGGAAWAVEGLGAASAVFAQAFVVAHALDTPNRILDYQGLAYGATCDVVEAPDPRRNPSWPDGGEDNAFHEGLQKGKAAVRDNPRLRNHARIAIGRDHRGDPGVFLNEVWQPRFTSSPRLRETYCGG